MNRPAPTRARVDDPLGGASEELVILAAVGERLRAERDWAICGAHRHGVPVAAIARMMKMSDRDISQILAG